VYVEVVKSVRVPTTAREGNERPFAPRTPPVPRSQHQPSQSIFLESGLGPRADVRSPNQQRSPQVESRVIVDGAMREVEDRSITQPWPPHPSRIV
jgi:hypothetical protein